MTQPSNPTNKYHQLGRNPTSFNDDNIHSTGNAAALSFQSFVDDIPFEFNPKYRTIIVPNTNIPEFDTTKICNIIAKPINFTLENKVLCEALEDLKRKKKELQENKSSPSPSVSNTAVTNCPTTGSTSVPSNTLTETIPFSAAFVATPPLVTLQSSRPTTNQPVSINTLPPPASISASTAATVNKSSVSTSYQLPSVRDIYWPTGNQQQYSVPTIGPSAFTANSFNLPTPMRSAASPTALVQPSNQSCHSCDSATANDLAATFDGALGSDDPFHEAELKSLNDVAELRHLYSNIGPVNTVQR